MQEVVIRGRFLHDGIADSQALVSSRPFGFAHGVDPATGIVTDPQHDWYGRCIRDRILVFPSGKGSSTGALWILEAVRLGNAPAGVVNSHCEPVIAAGLIMANLLYGTAVPVMDSPDRDVFDLVRSGDRLLMDSHLGTVTLLCASVVVEDDEMTSDSPYSA